MGKGENGPLASPATRRPRGSISTELAGRQAAKRAAPAAWSRASASRARLRPSRCASGPPASAPAPPANRNTDTTDDHTRSKCAGSSTTPKFGNKIKFDSLGWPSVSNWKRQTMDFNLKKKRTKRKKKKRLERLDYQRSSSITRARSVAFWAEFWNANLSLCVTGFFCWILERAVRRNSNTGNNLKKKNENRGNKKPTVIHFWKTWAIFDLEILLNGEHSISRLVYKQKF